MKMPAAALLSLALEETDMDRRSLPRPRRRWTRIRDGRVLVPRPRRRGKP